MKNAVPAARDDVASLRSYQAGAQVDNTIRLNANEAPVSHDALPLNRYPEVHPDSVRDRIAELMHVAPANLLVTRGSSEAIDVLIRTWCRAYRDGIITTPPTFEMYRVYADLQGARRIEVPLDIERDFALDPDAVIDAVEEDTRLVFICSPNNPTGSLVPRQDILRIVGALAGRAVVVVDEAYVEFSDAASLVSVVNDHANLVVLRTLSKAHALAGARCGAAVACPDIVELMAKVLPPYSFPTPVIDSVLAALADDRLALSRESVADIVRERERVFDVLTKTDCVIQCWRSSANFILVRFRALADVQAALMKRRILIRQFGALPELTNCARITVGARTENDLLLETLAGIGGKP